jgi:hypothetical protein
MGNRIRYLYPFLFSVVPLLHVLARNPGGSDPSDVAQLTGIMLASTAVIFGVVAVLVGNRWPKALVPLIVFAGVFWFYSFSPLSHGLRAIVPGSLSLLVVAVGLVLTIIAVGWLARRPIYLERVTTFLSLTGTILVGWSLARVGIHAFQFRDVVARSGLAQELARPIPVKAVARPAGTSSLRDIYLIVLDEYANSSVLRERFGFDNREFEDSLRALGFTIPRIVRSNYVHTLLSLPALLNFSHLTRLQVELGPEENDPTLPNYLVENSRTAAFLKARGYAFLYYPSQWWISTRHNRNADWEFRAWKEFELAREATRSDLRRWFVRVTVFPTNYRHDADHVTRTLRAIGQVPDVDRPTFAFAHIISPHNPYVVDSECRTLPPRARGRYVDQLQCVNRLLLDLVSTLVRQSSPKPIIVLQGDHGTNSLRYSDEKTAFDVSAEQAEERFGAFGAYYLPDGGDRLFQESTTLVNVLRNVLVHYFGADIAPAPDRLYMSTEGTPYQLVEFDPVTLRPVGRSSAASR